MFHEPADVLLRGFQDAEHGRTCPVTYRRRDEPAVIVG